MRHDIVQEMLDYFKSKPALTSQESRFLLFLQSETGLFEIDYICREDLETIGYDGENVSDNQMEKIASKMSCLYAGNSFWKDFESCVKLLEIPKIQ